MHLPARVKAILVAPRTEWPVIAEEATTPRAIYVGYAAPLAAIGAIALFAGQVFIGTPLPLVGLVRASIAEGSVAAVFTFALALASVWVLARIIDALAPHFGGQRDPLRALKVIHYSYTPAWLAGVLQVIPAWGLLTLPANSLRSLHSLPRHARAEDAVASGSRPVPIWRNLMCAIVLFFLFGGLTTCVAGFGPGVFS